MKVPALPFPGLRERANPVLVRELRQSFRGKQFRIVFALASTLGLVASFICMVAEPDPSEMGQALFIAIGVALSIACIVLVPVGAFQSLSSEWEEGTWDLLEMSSLRPWRIVTGKLLAAGIQCLLYFVGLAPFLVFCFVLRGVGLQMILYLIGHLVVGALAATSVALALSSLTRQRILRGILLSLLVLFLVQIGMGAGGMMAGAMFAGGRIGGAPPGAVAMVVFSFLAGMGLVTAVACSIACARLSHPEENRSTALRIVASTGVLLQLLVTTGLRRASGSGGDETIISLCMMALGITVFSALFASERDTFGRRTRLQVPRSALRARLAAPWLPGGGRGVLWLCLHLLLVIGAAPLLLARGPGWVGEAVSAYRLLLAVWIPGLSGAADTDLVWRADISGLARTDADGVIAIAVLACYLLFYVGVATSVLSWIRTENAPLRVARAMAPLFLFVVTALVPSLIGLLLADGELTSLSHPFNPIFVIGGLLQGDDVYAWRWYPPLVGLTGLLLALPRCRRALVEVAQASLARCERERALPPVAGS